MPANVPAPDALQRMPVKGMPAWPQRYDMRFVEGAFPTAFDEQEQTHSRSTLWVRDEPARAMDFASLAAMSDSFFSAHLRQSPPSRDGWHGVHDHLFSRRQRLAGAGVRAPCAGCGQGAELTPRLL